MERLSMVQSRRPIQIVRSDPPYVKDLVLSISLLEYDDLPYKAPAVPLQRQITSAEGSRVRLSASRRLFHLMRHPRAHATIPCPSPNLSARRLISACRARR